MDEGWLEHKWSKKEHASYRKRSLTSLLRGPGKKSWQRSYVLLQAGQLLIFKEAERQNHVTGSPFDLMQAETSQTDTTVTCELQDGMLQLRAHSIHSAAAWASAIRDSGS